MTLDLLLRQGRLWTCDPATLFVIVRVSVFPSDCELLEGRDHVSSVLCIPSAWNGTSAHHVFNKWTERTNLRGRQRHKLTITIVSSALCMALAGAYQGLIEVTNAAEMRSLLGGDLRAAPSLPVPMPPIPTHASPTLSPQGRTPRPPCWVSAAHWPPSPAASPWRASNPTSAW